MAAMTGGAGGRAEIPGGHHGFVVNAGGVTSELIGGDVVGLHVVSNGVTTFAGFGDVQRMDARQRIRRRPDGVRGMTVRTDGYTRITMRKLDAMRARAIELELIGAQLGVRLRVQLLDAIDIGMAGTTELWNPLALDDELGRGRWILDIRLRHTYVGKSRSPFLS